MNRKLCVEFVGAFFLVLTIGLTIIGAKPESASLALAPLAIGSMLMVMVYAGGHISGAHYNPAVTIAVFLRGKCSAADALTYIGAQLVAAAAGAAVVGYLKGGFPVPPAPVAVGPAFLVEFLFTFALSYVVLNVATAKGTEGNSNYGLAIGFTVMCGAFAGGSISGGAFNPAVALAITMMQLSAVSTIWVLIAGEVLGGVTAAILFNALRFEQGKPTNADAIQERFLAGAAET